MTYSQQMLEALQEDRLNDYAELFDQALTNDPIDELYRLADTLYELGFYPDLERLIYRLLESDTQNDSLRIRLAEIAMEEGDDERAFSILFDIETSSSAYGESLLLQADLYQQQGFLEVSERKLLKAYDVTNHQPIVKFALMELYYYLQRFNEAIAGYEELIEMGYDNIAGTDLLKRVGTAYLEIADYNKAASYLSDGIAKQETADAYHLIGLAYMGMQAYDRAITAFNKVIEQDPSYSTTYTSLADAYAKNNELKAALATIQDGLALDQMNAQLYQQGATYARQLKDNELAKAYYEESLQLEPEQVAVRLDYIALLLNEGAYTEVLDTIDVAKAEEVTDPRFYWAQAQAYNALETFEKANAAYNKASAYLQSDSQFLSDFIGFLIEDGQREKALTEVDNYLAINPMDESMLALKADLTSDAFH